MRESSQLTEQRHTRRPSRNNANHPVHTQNGGDIQSLTSDASIGSMGLSDSNASGIPSGRDDELRDLRSQINKYKKTNQELKQSLSDTNAMLKEEQTKTQDCLIAYHFVFDRTVRPYAKSRRIEISGGPDEHMAWLAKDLVRDAAYSYVLRTQMQQLRSESQHQQEQISILQKKNTDLCNAEEKLQFLQAKLLSRVESIATVSDEHLTQEFCSLISGVRVLSRSIQVPKNVNILNVLNPCGFLVGVPKYHWESRAVKKVYIEAWIWCVLVKEIFNDPLSIFGEHGHTLGQYWSLMFGNGHFGGWPYPSSSSETWRHVTTERLLELNGRDTFTQGLAELEEMAIKGDVGFASHVYNQRKHVVNILGGQLSALSATADLMQIPKIVTRASCLALDMLLSRSRIQITYPQTGAQFDEKAMSVRDTDDESLDNRTVALVVTPGMTKWGDAHGKHFEESLDIVTSEVQLEAGGAIIDGSESVDLMTG
jgi:hypothetical protein